VIQIKRRRDAQAYESSEFPENRECGSDRNP
jgi:hypothetical protein